VKTRNPDPSPVRRLCLEILEERLPPGSVWGAVSSFLLPFADLLFRDPSDFAGVPAGPGLSPPPAEVRHPDLSEPVALEPPSGLPTYLPHEAAGSLVVADHRPPAAPPPAGPWAAADWGGAGPGPRPAQGPAGAAVQHTAPTGVTPANFSAVAAVTPATGTLSPALATALAGSPPPGPSVQAPIAVDDDNVGLHHALYIARENLGAAEPTVYNVSADAGVQVNDYAYDGDTLISSPFNPMLPFTITPVGGFSAPFATTMGGTVVLGADGSFSYTPPVGFTGVDHFMYVDTDVDQFTGRLGLNSSPATVSIPVAAQTPTPLVPGGAMALDTFLGWPKFHNTTDNAGIATNGPRPGGPPLILGNPLPPHLPTTGVQGSPVLGFGGMGPSPTVFVEGDDKLFALSLFPFGNPQWASPFPLVDSTLHNAPAVVTAGPPGMDFLLVGAAADSANLGFPDANLLVLSGATGSLVSGFATKETVHETPGAVGMISSATGPIRSSPTVIPPPAPGAAGNAVVFGVDIVGDDNHSGGRLYAVRPDGKTAWETLVAGAIHGSPLYVPPSGTPANPDGFIYVGVGTDNTAWGGRPPLGEGSTHSGRFYQIDALTGQVKAEMFEPQEAVDGSAVLLPGPGTPGDPLGTGTSAQIFFTDRYGEVFDVSQIPAAPPPGIETPTLPTTLLSTNVGPNPTSPALSIGGAEIYVGTSQGLRGIPVPPGTLGGFDLRQDPAGNPLGPVLGTPAVVFGGGGSQVVFGTTGAPPGLYDVLDPGPGGPTPSVLWGLNNLQDSSGATPFFGLSSPAVGGPPVAGAGTIIFIGSSNGGFFAIG
jgi:hypothetical protein